jgi:hypothetical protein
MNQPTAFLYWLRCGQKYGYPECCIMQFARDCLEGKQPGRLRGLDPTGRYVPCDACRVLLPPLNPSAHVFMMLLEAAEHACDHMNTYGILNGDGKEGEMKSQNKAFTLLLPAIAKARRMIGENDEAYAARNQCSGERQVPKPV